MEITDIDKVKEFLGKSVKFRVCSCSDICDGILVGFSFVVKRFDSDGVETHHHVVDQIFSGDSKDGDITDFLIVQRIAVLQSRIEVLESSRSKLMG